jgi:hypothetical protein
MRHILSQQQNVMDWDLKWHAPAATKPAPKRESPDYLDNRANS